MTKRKIALINARVAGYHQDGKSFTRLIIESRVNRESMNAEWRNGVKMREAGVKCNCRECNQAA